MAQSYWALPPLEVVLQSSMCFMASQILNQKRAELCVPGPTYHMVGRVPCMAEAKRGLTEAGKLATGGWRFGVDQGSVGCMLEVTGWPPS